jgi:hypothetical protein
LFAGRNISATHVAFSSTRVMATCAVVGQGVGTAAALALRQGVMSFDMTADADLLCLIQQQLLKDDCYLIGARNDDDRDLVRCASDIIASSAQVRAEPELVRSGRTRTVGCVPSDRARSGTERWMSDPGRGFPAWLEIRWAAPVSVREIRLILDTGLHRLLTLSQADGYTQKMLWGRPQPETVRDYVLSLRTAAGWHDVVTVEGNYQRRRVHRFDECRIITALRITVTDTNGLDHARILEVRAYS